jgi:uncharacterized protein
MSILLSDPLHREILIEEPVLCELIDSPPMWRLRDIDMGAYSRGFFPGAGFSRFEHSVGVYYLLSMAGASIEEQVHGLLHDVNHTVFSHAIDYILSEGSERQQSYQDDHYTAFFYSSCLPAILEKHGLDPKFIVEDDHFPLEERPIPELCADRLDYALRSLYHYRLMALPELLELLAELRSDGKVWYFSNLAAATRFATAFAALDDAVFDSFRSGVMYRSIGDCIAYALRQDILSPGDLLTTDSAVIAKIENNLKDDVRLCELWKRMNGQVRAEPSSAVDALEVHCKSRIVDPLFRTDDGDVQKLSEADPAWRLEVSKGMIAKSYHFHFLHDS